MQTQGVESLLALVDELADSALDIVMDVDTDPPQLRISNPELRDGSRVLLTAHFTAQDIDECLYLIHQPWGIPLALARDTIGAAASIRHMLIIEGAIQACPVNDVSTIHFGGGSRGPAALPHAAQRRTLLGALALVLERHGIEVKVELDVRPRVRILPGDADTEPQDILCGPHRSAQDELWYLTATGNPISRADGAHLHEAVTEIKRRRGSGLWDGGTDA